MAFPTTSILDTFNRANENPLSDGGKWSSPILSGDAALKIVSNQCVAGSGQSDSYWSASKFGPDCEVFVDIVATPVEPSIACRTSLENTGAPNAYFGNFVESGGFYQIVLVTAGGNTTLVSTSGTLLNGDSFGMSAIGSLISLWRKTGGEWSLATSIVDTTLAGSGHIGAFMFSGNADAYANFGGGTAGIVSDTVAESLQYQLH